MQDDTTTAWSRRRLLASGGALAAALAGCVGGGPESDASETDTADGPPATAGAEETDAMDGTDMADTESMDGTDMAGTDAPDGTDMAGTQRDLPTWQTTELEPVRDGDPFTVGSVSEPVVVQAFAVWCPKCDRQQEILAGMSDVRRISLNIDQNEDAERVRTHANNNGFDWTYVVAPSAMVRSLVDSFGSTVANAPSTPLIVTCPDGSTTFMSGERHSAEKIQSALDDC